MKYKYSLIMTTFSKKKEAKKVSKKIISKRLATCIQIQKIDTLYAWHGEIQNENEYLLFIKTKSNRFKKLESFIKKHHSYKVPQIIQIPITKGSKEYLSWIETNTK